MPVTQITSLGVPMGVTSVSISSIKMIAGEFSQANQKMSASGGRMFTSAYLTHTGSGVVVEGSMCWHKESVCASNY